MINLTPHHFIRRKLAMVAPLLLFLAASANGAIRGPGKYSGVVIFDRWDSCFTAVFT